MDQYLPILIWAFLGLALHRRSPWCRRPCWRRARSRPLAKLAPYECGIVPNREPPQRFPVRFYLVSMIFIIFDIEIVFLYPWAVVFHQIATFGLIEVIVFAAVVFVSFLYLISNGALDLGPAQDPAVRHAACARRIRPSRASAPSPGVPVRRPEAWDSRICSTTS